MNSSKESAQVPKEKQIREEEPWGKLVSVNKNLEEVNLTKTVYKIGRHSLNDIVIRDIRISGLHCLIKHDEKDFVIIEDLSSNGTYVGDQKLGKGKARILFPGDKFYLLHTTQVEPEDALGYQLVMTKPVQTNPLKRDRDDGWEVPLIPSQKLKPQNSIVGTDLGEEMRCCICIDYIYNCVTALPCLHNFCAACYSEWMQRSEFCPQCREEVVEVKKNSMINNLVEKFLEKHPQHRRSREDYEEMDNINIIKQDRMKIVKREKPKETGPNLKGSCQNSRDGQGANCNEAKSTPEDRAAKINALMKKFIA